MLVDVKVRNTAPLMLDKFTIDLLNGGPKSTNGKEELSPKDQAEAKLYTDDKGIPIIPADNLLSCIIDAGRYVKIGKRQQSTRDGTLVTSYLALTDEFLPIRSENGWRVDGRGVVNQATKGRHVCYRPLFDDWGLDFTLDIDTSQVSLKTVRELIDWAGRAIGIGVMRPARKGRYGKFKVNSWKEHTQP